MHALENHGRTMLSMRLAMIWKATLMERAPSGPSPTSRDIFRPNPPKPNPSQTKPDQEKGLGFSWIPSSDSSLFNGLRVSQVTGAKVRARKQPFGFWRAGELASDSSDSISHSQHHLLCECVPGLLPLFNRLS